MNGFPGYLCGTVLPAIYRQAGFLCKPTVLMRSVNRRDWRACSLSSVFPASLTPPHPELVEGCSSLAPGSASFDKLRTR
jgi:hypothetical protein